MLAFVDEQVQRAHNVRFGCYGSGVVGAWLE